MNDADSSLRFIPEVSVQDAQAIDRVAAIVREHPAIMPAKKQVSGHEFTRAVQPKKNLGFSPCHKTPQGLKAKVLEPQAARLKSCPDTCLVSRSKKLLSRDIHHSIFLRASAVCIYRSLPMIVMKLSRFAGVSEAGARRRNPERAQRVEGSHELWPSGAVPHTAVPL
jgi:hypothetical protein